MQPLPSWVLQQQHWSRQLHKLLTRFVEFKLFQSGLLTSYPKSVETCLIRCPQVSIRPIRAPLHVHHVHWELSASKLASSLNCTRLPGKRSLSTITCCRGCVRVDSECYSDYRVLLGAARRLSYPGSVLSLQQLLWLCSVSDVSRRNRSSANCC